VVDLRGSFFFFNPDPRSHKAPNRRSATTDATTGASAGGGGAGGGTISSRRRGWQLDTTDNGTVVGEQSGGTDDREQRQRQKQHWQQHWQHRADHARFARFVKRYGELFSG
jgi:hypothetical protein